MAGIFISKGMTVTIPAGGLKISLGPDGPSIPSVTLHVHFDVCPTWCELAMTHLASANSHEAARVLAWQGTDENEKAKSLEREFESSMQAVMAAAIAIDAFYAVVRGHVQIPPELVDKWRVRRTARYSQVTEVLRRGFHLKPKGTKALRDNLKEIYRFRDMAVHPSGRIQAALLHPDLDVGVEWAFCLFQGGKCARFGECRDRNRVAVGTSRQANDREGRQLHQRIASTTRDALPIRASGVEVMTNRPAVLAVVQN